MKAIFVLLLLLPLVARGLPIVVDPATPLTGTYAVEWQTAGNFESWTTKQVTGAKVASGVLSGKTNGADPQIYITNLTGPDLDLGFNDYVEIRIKVPASFVGDLQIYYGTTATTGFSSNRMLTIPSAIIPKDGAFHAYRIDVGPEPWWRSTLHDLRVDPGGVSGVSFSIDYIRVGDLPGDVYLPNTTDQPVIAYELSSKHFRFIWNEARQTNDGINATVARGSLRNAEEAWQVYVKELGYREPAETTNLPARDGNKYKVNFLCIYDGYWMGGSPTSFGYLNIEPSGLQVDPPTWVLPHELMHVFQMHNTSGNMPGEWWETHANYGRERWLYHYANLYPDSSNIDAQAVRDAHLMMSSGRNYYLTWLFFLYLDENPDALPDLYDGIVAKIWQETQPGEFPTTALDRLTPTTSLKDIVGYYARRGATFDYSPQSQLAITAALNNQDPTRNARHVFSDLIQRPDAPGWWRVPLEKAPAQGTYSIHELVPAGTGAGRVVTVNFHGLTDSERGADWRASFIAVSDAGVARYTPLWNSGSSSITLAANENKLYLSVAGTPDLFYYGGHDESIYPYRSHPSRSRFHYELQVTGATPRERDNDATTGLVQHANGSGWKASSATVDATAYIGPNARVLDSAIVSDNARVEDYAVVQGAAQILNNAVVSGHAWVLGSAIVQDYGRVRDWGIVDGTGIVSGNGRVIEHATVEGTVTDNAVAKGSAIAWSGGTLSGNAIVDGDYVFGKSISNGVTCGHLPYVGIPDSFTKATPGGLYAAYDFSTIHDSRVLDQYGVTDAFPVGSPPWTSTDGLRQAFLSFNGTDQYITLNRSVADTRAFTFAAWVKPLGGAANQAVLWLGASPTRRLTFTPDDGAGHAKFSIANGGTDQTLTAPSALPLSSWSHVAITLDGTTGTLYVNGAAVASAPNAILPYQLLAANTTTAAQHNYLCRAQGSVMPMFHGSLDDAQFFTSALSQTEIHAVTVPLSSNGTWTGGGSTTHWTDSDNWLGGIVGGDWKSVTFDGNTVVGTVSIDYFHGTSSLTLANSLTQDITLNGPQPLIMSSGTITIATGSRDLTIHTDYWSQGPVLWDIGSGRTLACNNSLSDWNSMASLIKQGDGTAVLAAANTYTGTTTINGGTLKLQNSYASSGFVVASGAVLELNGGWDGATTTFSGNGTLCKTGAGNSVWGSGVATFALDSGALIDVQGGTFTGGAYANEVWTDNRSDLNIASGAVFTTVEANVRVNKITGTGTIQTGYSGAGYANLTIGVDNGSSTFYGVIQDAGAAGNLVKTGTGTITLTGTNTYTGTTTISAGALRIQNDHALGAGGFDGGTMTFVSDGATLEIDGSLNISEHMHIAGAGVGGNGALRVLSGNSTLTTQIAFDNPVNIDVAGGASLTQSSQFYNDSGVVGSLTKSGDGTLVLSGPSNYSGGTGIIGGTLRFAAGSLNSTAYVNLLGGTLQWATGNTDALNKIYIFNGTTGTLDTHGNNVTLSGIQDNDANRTGSLVKTGAGVLTFTGVSTYTGNTTVTQGVLSINNPFLNNSSSVSIATGAKMDLNFSGDNTVASVTLGGTTYTTPGRYNAATYPQFFTGGGSLVISGANDYNAWKTANGVTGGINDDDDHDGLTNFQEYAFGLIPNSGSSVNPITVPLDKTAGTFTYIRRDPSKTGIGYKIFYSANLTDWHEDTGAGQHVTGASGDVQTVGVSLSSSLLSKLSLFIQVRVN